MSTSAIHLALPASVVVRGTLRSRSVIQNLSEDMVQYELPDGTKIDVGWYPDWDPNGEYRIIVFNDDFSAPLETPIHTRDELELEHTLYRLILKYSRLFSVHGSGQSTSTNVRDTYDDCFVDTAVYTPSDYTELVA